MSRAKGACSQGTPFRRVLLTTISGRDTTAKLARTDQSFVAGGHSSRTEIHPPGVYCKMSRAQGACSQGTPFRRVLSTTISGRDTIAKPVETYQSFVAGGHSSRTKFILPGCIARCHAPKVRAPKGHHSAGFYQRQSAGVTRLQNQSKRTSHLWLAGISAGLKFILPGCIARCHARKVHAPKGHHSAGFYQRQSVGMTQLQSRSKRTSHLWLEAFACVRNFGG
jgi:hypothetical protein